MATGYRTESETSTASVVTTAATIAVTTVVNLRKEKYDVYIGRAGKGQRTNSGRGKWGNPFSKGTREENIEAYTKWIFTQRDLLADLDELRGKRLGCFCKPQACHGDVLAALADLPVSVFPIFDVTWELYARCEEKLRHLHGKEYTMTDVLREAIRVLTSKE